MSKGVVERNIPFDEMMIQTSRHGKSDLDCKFNH